jgi:hypothetical protein
MDTPAGKTWGFSAAQAKKGLTAAYGYGRLCAGDSGATYCSHFNQVRRRIRRRYAIHCCILDF